VDVIIWIIGRVVLDNPVNFGEVKTSLSDIGAKEDSGFGLAKLKVCACPLLLLLFPVDVFNWNIDVVKKVGIEFDGITT
jgi:hypothetical protein